MEEDLKILKVEYLSNRFLDHTMILNVSLDDQNHILQVLKMKTISNGRQSPMEGNLQMEDNLQWKTTFNGRQPQNIKCGISQPPLIGSGAKMISKWVE